MLLLYTVVDDYLLQDNNEQRQNGTANTLQFFTTVTKIR
jgi:hypothetical protein